MVGKSKMIRRFTAFVCFWLVTLIQSCVSSGQNVNQPQAIETAEVTQISSLTYEIASATVVPFSTHTDSPTPNVCDDNFSSGSLSPDKTWAMVLCRTVDDQPFTRVLKVDEPNRFWDVSFYDTYSPISQDDIVSHLMRKVNLVIEHWSQDSRYLYLQPEFCCIDGPGLLFISNYALYRLELSTGDFTAILPPFSPYAFSFSPNDRYFAYINSDIPKVIHLNELETGATLLIPLNKFYGSAGRMVWTPDSREFVFVAVENDWLDKESPVFTIFLYDVANNSSQILLDDHRRLYPSPENNGSYWIGDDELLFRDAGSNVSDGVWKLNIRTKEFVQYIPE